MPRRLTTRGVVLGGLMAALLVAVKEPLAALPAELVTPLLILYTLTMPALAPWVIAVFILLECLLYGFGLWLWMYLYIWFVLYGIVRLCRHGQGALFWAVVAGGFGLAFGALCAPSYLFLQGPGGMVAWWLAGIPHDVAHGICNFFTMLLLYTPLRRILDEAARRAGVSPDANLEIDTDDEPSHDIK